MSHSGMSGSQAQQYSEMLNKDNVNNAPVLLPTPAGRFLHKYSHKAATVQRVLRKIETSLMEGDLNIRERGIIVKLDDVLNEKLETEDNPFQIELLVYLHNRLYPLGWDLRRHLLRPDHVVIKPLIQANLYVRT